MKKALILIIIIILVALGYVAYTKKGGDVAYESTAPAAEAEQAGAADEASATTDTQRVATPAQTSSTGAVAGGGTIVGTVSFDVNKAPQSVLTCLTTNLGSDFVAAVRRGPVEVNAAQDAAFNSCIAAFLGTQQ